MGYDMDRGLFGIDRSHTSPLFNHIPVLTIVKGGKSYGKKIKNNENATVQLPVLALRGLVLFPHMVLHFDVGREQSLHSLNMAMNGDRKVFLVAQVDQMRKPVYGRFV